MTPGFQFALGGLSIVGAGMIGFGLIANLTDVTDNPSRAVKVSHSGLVMAIIGAIVCLSVVVIAAGQ